MQRPGDGTGTTDAPAPALEIAFRRRGFWTLWMAAIPLGVLAGGGAAWVATFRGAPTALFALLPVLAAAALAAVAVVVLRALLRPRAQTRIEFFDDALVLPLRAESRRSRRVEYEDVLSVDVYGTKRFARLVIDARERIFVYRLGAFEDGEAAAERIREEIRKRIGAVQPTLLTAMDQREARGRAVIRNPPAATTALVALNVAVFAWQHVSGAFERPFGLVGYGANVPALVAGGEWHRLFAANFLHAGLLHIYLNALGILVLGVLIEKLLGGWRLLLLYLTGALAGSAASAWVAPGAMSVGASTAVFALLGALAVVNWRFRAQLPGGFRQPFRWWLVVLGLNIILPLVVPVIDYAAHLGGFMAGLVGGWLLCRRPPTDDGIAPPAGAGVKLAAAALAVVTGGALAQAIVAAPGDSAAELRVAEAAVREAWDSPSTLNRIAWSYATLAGASAAELDLAVRAAERALALEPESAAITDTIATAYYRVGRFADAIDLERRAVALEDSRLHLLQLARFLAAHLRTADPIELGGASVADVTLSIAASIDDAADVIADVHRPLPNGATIYAVLMIGARAAGIAVVELGEGVMPGRHSFRVAKPWSAFRWPPPGEPRVALIDGSCACERGTVGGRLVAMNRSTAELP